jgi:hypothetical protein
MHTVLSLSLLYAFFLITSGRKKRRNETATTTKKAKHTRRSARFGARLENVKVVFSLYRFVRGHRTDYAEDQKKIKEL